MSKLQLLVAFLAFTIVACYETEEGVIVVTKDDYEDIVDQHPQLMLELYAPWCGHCKKLAPIYSEAAGILEKQGSKVKLAKIDDTAEKLDDHRFKITGYPTLFFIDGDDVSKYEGDRTSEAIVRWVNKRVTPVTELKTVEEIETLKKALGVSVVLLTNQPSDTRKFTKLARDDLSNDYYVLSSELNKDAKDTSVTLFTNFTDPISFKGTLNSVFKYWLLKNSRPSVVPVDEATVNLIFKEHMNVVILFNGRKDDRLTNLLKETAKSFKLHDIVFAELRPEDANHEKITEFFGVDAKDTKLIGIDAGMNQKAVYRQSLSDSSAEDVAEFVTKLLDQKIKLYDYKEQIPAKPKEAAATEL